MTALTITPANVTWVSGPIDADQVAGEAFDAGSEVYKSTVGTWLKAQCDGTTLQSGQHGLGMALGSAEAVGGRVSIARAGAVVSVGAGLAGIVYIPGDTAGSLMPTADAGSTDKVTLAALGIGSGDLLLLEVYNAGAVIA